MDRKSSHSCWQSSHWYSYVGICYPHLLVMEPSITKNLSTSLNSISFVQLALMSCLYFSSFTLKTIYSSPVFSSYSILTASATTFSCILTSIICLIIQSFQKYRQGLASQK